MVEFDCGKNGKREWEQKTKYFSQTQIKFDKAEFDFGKNGKREWEQKTKYSSQTQIKFEKAEFDFVHVFLHWFLVGNWILVKLKSNSKD